MWVMWDNRLLVDYFLKATCRDTEEEAGSPDFARSSYKFEINLKKLQKKKPFG